MKKTKTAKAFAIFALLGIIISIVGTGILVFTAPSHQQTLTQEELQKILENTKVEATAQPTDTQIQTETQTQTWATQ